MEQPQAIINDAARAIRMWEDEERVSDRFGDDVDQIEFWVQVARTQHEQLMKATGLRPLPRGDL